MTAKDAWTPYGLEAIRIAYLRRRRIMAFLLVLGLAGLLAAMVDVVPKQELEIWANGNKQGGGSLRLDVNEPEVEDKPVTVSLSPGRVTRAETSREVGASETTRSQQATLERAPAYNWTYYLLAYGPWLLLLAALWFLGKRRGKYDEVNFGVYKGAMPLEMITASAKSHVLTTRHARSSIFGKRRADHLPREVVTAERVPQEGDA